MIETSKCNFVARCHHIRLLGGFLFFMVVIYSSTADAYQLYDWKWPQPSTTFYVDISGEDDLWNNSFETAMYCWGVDTTFEFMIVRGEYEDPCDPREGRNGVGFELTDCGDAWGSTTLAVTHMWYVGTTLTQTDITFNSNESWNIYSTSWASWPWSGVSDFQRVAIHELGHALGLAHEDSGIATIMRTYAGDIIIPQKDDINGVGALYGFPIIDTDGDGVPDSTDNCPMTANENQDDSDSDSIGNVCDSCPNDQDNDLDSDGVCGDIDVCPIDPLKSSNAGQCGCNIAETDSDNDGTADCLDQCPNDSDKTEPGVCDCGTPDTDSDSDGIADCIDTDNDGDGASSEIDCDDNDASIYPGASEVCDNKDNDCDGFIDENMTRITSCGLGICDTNTGIETCIAGIWNNNTCNSTYGAITEICGDSIDQDCNGADLSCIDSDDDGITDDVEDANQNGIVDIGETDPFKADTDDDGLQDGTELNYTLGDIGIATDINLFQPDLDPLTQTDPLLIDTDDDGKLDGVEDANQNGMIDGEESDPLDPNDPCETYGYLVIHPGISALSSSDTDKVVFFDSNQSLCFEMMAGSCIKESRVCTGQWDFGGEGDIVGGNGHDILVFRYDEAGDYSANLTITEQESSTTVTDNLTVTADILETPLPDIDFETIVDPATSTVSLTIPDVDVDTVIVFWGDRNRTEYTGSLPATLEQTYTRTGTDYHIRVKTVTGTGEVFNYTFTYDEDLTVYIP